MVGLGVEGQQDHRVRVGEAHQDDGHGAAIGEPSDVDPPLLARLLDQLGNEERLTDRGYTIIAAGVFPELFVFLDSRIQPRS